MPLNPQMFQYVTITLNDGTRCTFTGPAMLEYGDKRRITDIKFSVPRPLGPGIHFEPILQEALNKAATETATVEPKPKPKKSK